MTTVALKQRRYRERQREPVRAVYRIEAEQDRLIEALIASDRLSENEAWRRDLVELAVSQLVDEWITENIAMTIAQRNTPAPMLRPRSGNTLYRAAAAVLRGHIDRRKSRRKSRAVCTARTSSSSSCCGPRQRPPR